jgi:hypothetical protein
MNMKKIAALVLALFLCGLPELAGAASSGYSGIPGQFKRASKSAKAKAKGDTANRSSKAASAKKGKK